MTEKSEAEIELEGMAEETEEELPEQPAEEPVLEIESEAEPVEGGELEALQDELERAKAQAAEYLDGWQRARAELSNYKKRQAAGRVQETKLANANLLRRLLPVVDDFERATKTLPSDLRQLDWCEGLFLVKHKLDAVLEAEDVKPIETEGQKFDPRYHEAVTHEEAPGYEEDQIIDEVQRGYMLDEWVLRPALVRVAKAPAGPEAEEVTEAEENADITEEEEE